MSACPKCGHQAAADATACPDCGHAMNGAVSKPRPAAPPEVARWVIEPIPPDVLAWARETLNEEEMLAGIREIEQTGGLQLEDFIEEIEEIVNRREPTNQ